jgi:ribosome-binding ATPase YchF (GTP1/OBG family)
MIFIANCSEEQLKEADELAKNFCPGVDKDNWIYLDALTEIQMMDLDVKEKQEMRQMLGLGAGSLEELIIQSFVKLNLITFFTFNQDEARAWQIPKDTPARQASSQIHQDFYRLFIKAKVADFDSFMNNQSRYRTEGENYLIKDGEIVQFIINQKS